MALKANKQAMQSKQWQPAVYARLSDEDKENKKNGVSLSIDNQIEILQDYVKSKGWQATKVFYDDDKTGTNFNRKGFQEMYAQAELGNINVIIIKDLSRFGRNWVQCGVYFEQIEEMGIRFISIQEGLDTADPNCPALKMLPFYFIFNEWHSATTSEKIKTVFNNMAKQGKYRTTYAPFGYKKDPDNKHKLIIDPQSSQVIKKIYEMRLQKYSYGAIVTALNSEGVLSPSAYSLETTGKTNIVSRQGKWSKDSLNVLFQNPAYMGDTANGKKRVTSYKNSKTVRVPMEDWIIVENTHEPVISREDWWKCYNMIKSLGRVRRTKDSEILPFTGFLKCRDCGYTMRHNHSYYTVKSGEKRRHNSYNCTLYLTSSKSACNTHYISQNDLVNVVCADIRKKAGEIIADEKAARERFNAIKSQADETQVKHNTNALKKAKKRLTELDKLIQAAFEKSVLSGETLTNLAQKYETEKLELTALVSQLTTSIEKQGQTENDVNTFIKLMKSYVNITEIDREMAVELIERIEVSAKTNEPREIIIYYNFIGNFE